MAELVIISLLVFAFCAAGFVNIVGTAATRRDFARWGFPAWWGRLTGGLELAAALLLALPLTRSLGIALSAAILAAAAATVLRHRDFAHLAPLGLFAALTLLAAI